MSYQQFQKRPGIRLKQLQILKSRENTSYKDDPEFFLQPIIEYASKPVIKQTDGNRQKSRRRIFETRDKSPQQSRIKNSKSTNGNMIQKYQQQISKMKQQIQEKEIKLLGLQNKMNELIFHHETETKKKQSEIQKLNNKLKEFIQQINIKDNQIQALKLELQRNNRFNHLLNQNQRLSTFSNFKKKQNFNIFDDFGDNRNRANTKYNENNIKFRNNNEYIPAAKNTLDLGLILSNSNHRKQNKKEQKYINEYIPKTFDFDKTNKYNFELKHPAQQIKKESIYKNQQKTLQFYDFENQSNSFTKNRLKSTRQVIKKPPQQQQQQEQEIQQYLSPLDIDIGKSKYKNKGREKSGFIQNSKEFHFQDLRNIQEFQEYLKQ